MKLSICKRSRSDISHIDFNAIKMQHVRYLPPRYNSDINFEFPPLGDHGQHSIPKQLRGMDRRYDGHAWTQIMASNIHNYLKLTFWTSSCPGHLQCNNVDCDNLKRDHGTRVVIKTKWDGLSEKLFEVGYSPLASTRVACKFCNPPPMCIWLYPAKIYYVTSTPQMIRVCVQSKTHENYVKSVKHGRN